MSKLKTFYIWTRSHKLILFFVLLLIAIAVLAGVVSVVRAPGESDAVPANNTLTIKTGKVVCLPHKNSDGPHTMECAFGLHGQDTRHYALKDDAEPGQSPVNGVFDKRVEVTGTFTQTNDTPYDIAGTISITKLKVLE